MDNSTPDITVLLIDHIDGILPADKKQQLEKQLAADPIIKEEWENLLGTAEAVKLYGLQQKVGTIHRDMMTELQTPVRTISPVRRIVRYTIAVAASVLLVALGITGYNFYQLSPDKVFTENYSFYEVSNTRGSGSTITEAEKAYQEKNYKEVISIHDQGSEAGQLTEFLAGVSALELDNNSKAITCFKEVMETNRQTNNKMLEDEAEYYLSLSYIRNRDYDFALELMKKIQDDPGHLYNEKITGKLIRQVKLLKWR
jgi:tetratricopeptide (TPR) repeat protein